MRFGTDGGGNGVVPQQGQGSLVPHGEDLRRGGLQSGGEVHVVLGCAVGRHHGSHLILALLAYVIHHIDMRAVAVAIQADAINVSGSTGAASPVLAQLHRHIVGIALVVRYQFFIQLHVACSRAVKCVVHIRFPIGAQQLCEIEVQSALRVIPVYLGRVFNSAEGAAGEGDSGGIAYRQSACGASAGDPHRGVCRGGVDGGQRTAGHLQRSFPFHGDCAPDAAVYLEGGSLGDIEGYGGSFAVRTGEDELYVLRGKVDGHAVRCGQGLAVLIDGEHHTAGAVDGLGQLRIMQESEGRLIHQNDPIGLVEGRIHAGEVFRFVPIGQGGFEGQTAPGAHEVIGNA